MDNMHINNLERNILNATTFLDPAKKIITKKEISRIKCIAYIHLLRQLSSDTYSVQNITNIIDKDSFKHPCVRIRVGMALAREAKTFQDYAIAFRAYKKLLQIIQCLLIIISSKKASSFVQFIQRIIKKSSTVFRCILRQFRVLSHKII